MPVKTRSYDAANYLTDEDSRANLLRDARDSGEPAYIAGAESAVTRSRELRPDRNDMGS